jgi:trk system potassium uptake protein TrkH
MLWYREISRVIGFYLYFLAATLTIPTSIALYYEFYADPSSHPQPHSSLAFLLTIFISLAIASIFHRLSKGARGVYYKREALALVASIWFISGLIGALPFYLSGTFESFTDSYFEAISGLTTTGATVMQAKEFDLLTGEEIPIFKVFSELYQVAYTYYGTISPVKDLATGEVLYTGVEAVSKALLFWRSFMQWLGGMGIIVLFVAVLPVLGVGGKSLFEAEVPGPTKDVLAPRIKETASYLWRIYLGFSLLEVFLLMSTNMDMPLFDAVTITFSNLSTGGFSIRNSSIASYQNSNTEWVVILFMLIGSINFALYFQCLRGKIYRIFEPEFLTYFAIIFITCYIAILSLSGTPEFPLIAGTENNTTYSFMDSIRFSCFQCISAQTSTGFATANYDKWPFVNQILLLLVMYIGSMAGSTGGGIKIIRHIMAFRIVQNKVESIFRPQTIRKVRVGNKEVNIDAALTVLSFYLIVICLSAISTLLYAFDGIDLETALTTTACMINNIGIAFRAGGPSESFAFLTSTGKILSTLWMVLGRLEFFAILVVLVPAFWKK